MSTTENTPPTTDDEEVLAAYTDLEVLNPASGELLNLRELDTNDLALTVARIDEHVGEVAAFRKALVDEAVRRLDSLAKRKANVGGYELETNAPTTVDYREDVLRAGIEELVAAGELDGAILEQLWPTPAPPPPPAPKLNKRELNKLKADPRVAGAIAAASVRVNNTRTLKVRVAGEVEQ